MKKTLFITLCFLASVVSCQKEELVDVRELDPKLDARFISLIEEMGNGIPFPDGSTATRLPDGSMKLTLPEGFRYLFSDSKTNMLIEEGGGELGVTCTCTSGTGCSPVKFKNKYYCIVEDDCKVCVKSASLLNGNSVNIRGIYKPEAGITMISTKKQNGFFGLFTSLKSDVIGTPTPTFFELPEVKKQVFELYHFIYGKEIPPFILNNVETLPKGYVYIAINIMGNEAALPFPTEKLGSGEYIIATDGGDVSCKCNDTKPSGCSLNSVWGVKYCSAGSCHSCSLID